MYAIGLKTNAKLIISGQVHRIRNGLLTIRAPRCAAISDSESKEAHHVPLQCTTATSMQSFSKSIKNCDFIMNKWDLKEHLSPERWLT